MTTDILFDPQTGNILIENGELVVGDSTDQHTNHILLADKGWWKFTPSLGVGIVRFVNDVGNAPNLMATIRRELGRDGQNVDSISLQDSQIIVQSTYPS
ncbi:hypothetical protein [Spirosoma aerolatum]|uniref:hypothetical protein n=1 Tax=Spirosoma aerolatum TaxID=1211326 RepID=UPI0009ACBA14|nr:hypothetical protein [Spirosoma aerolatum]